MFFLLKYVISFMYNLHKWLVLTDKIEVAYAIEIETNKFDTYAG